MSYDRLSALDASFLHLESAATPMHVGSVGMLEGAPFFDQSGRFRLADARALVLSRLAAIPRFRRRLMAVPGEQGRPIWVDDERFDISFHVRLTALPKPGSWDQLRTLVGRIESQMLDRSRPLWELWFVEGLEGDRVAIVQKTHHSLVDGVSGVDVATVLLDATPEAPPVLPVPWEPEPAPSAAALLADTLRERSTEPGELFRTVRGAARTPQRVVQRTVDLGRAVRALVAGSPIAPRTSLNGPVSSGRRFAGVRISLAEVQHVRAQVGGTVNDVVLTGIGGALRRRLLERGDDVPDHLRVLCPVSVRATDERLHLGNRIAAMFVDLPLASPDPLERLHTVNATTADLKDRDQAAATAMLLDVTRFAAPAMLGVVARVVAHQPFVNLVVTNVPGPTAPLYCMGARLEEAYPIVPLSQNLSLGVAVLSYCDSLHIGLYADADSWADLDELAVEVRASFAEIYAAAVRRETTERMSG